MPRITVKVPTTNANIASVVGWIVTFKKKPEDQGQTPAQNDDFKIFVSDLDKARKDASGDYWVLKLKKLTGPRIRKNLLYVTSLDRRGEVIDSMIRKCKR